MNTILEKITNKIKNAKQIFYFFYYLSKIRLYLNMEILKK